MNRKEAMAEKWELNLFIFLPHIFLPVRPQGFGTEQGLTRQTKNPYSTLNPCGCLALPLYRSGVMAKNGRAKDESDIFRAPSFANRSVFLAGEQVRGYG